MRNSDFHLLNVIPQLKRLRTLALADSLDCDTDTDVLRP